MQDRFCAKLILVQIFCCKKMDYYCAVGDNTLRVKGKNKQIRSTTHKELETSYTNKTYHRKSRFI